MCDNYRAVRLLLTRYRVLSNILYADDVVIMGRRLHDVEEVFT